MLKDAHKKFQRLSWFIFKTQ